MVIEKMLTLTSQCTLETGPRVWLDRIMDPIPQLSRRQKERCGDPGGDLWGTLLSKDLDLQELNSRRAMLLKILSKQK